MNDRKRRYVNKAAQYARLKHWNQVDKAGVAYIQHLERVAAAVSNRTDDCAVIAAAWLHDIIEDTDTTRADLIRQGFSEETVFFVEALTKVKPVAYSKYLLQVMNGGLEAVEIKIADIRDNLNPNRSSETWKLSPAGRAKYTWALQACTNYRELLLAERGR